MNSSSKQLCSACSRFPYFVFCFSQFSETVCHGLQYWVWLCSGWCLTKSTLCRRHWFKKTSDKAEMKLLNYISFSIHFLKCMLLCFSSSHTQINIATINSFEMPAFNFYYLLRKCLRAHLKKHYFIFLTKCTMNNRFCNKSSSGKDKMHSLCKTHAWLCQAKP